MPGGQKKGGFFPALLVRMFHQFMKHPGLLVER